jgi:hypothetical protein
VNSTRKELLKAMRRVGEELLPLVDDYQKTAYSSFDPLPYTLLPNHSGRIIIRASQLLSATQSSHLGGAVFCAK